MDTKNEGSEGSGPKLSETIHFVGIGGAGMSGMARVLARQGVHITGSDARESPVLESLRQEYGIRAALGHAASNLNGATLVVASAAVKKDNTELQAAQARGIPVISRAEMLARLMKQFGRSIAISGTHGKTTTTGMTAMMLDAAGLDPTVLIGGDLPALGGNARLGASDVFLAEACEAYDSFLDLDPSIAVVTNVEADHLDYYGNLDNVLRSFRQFLSQVTGMAVLCGDSPPARQLAEEITGHGVPRVLLYGLGEDVTLRARDIVPNGQASCCTVLWDATPLGTLSLRVPGLHNVANALAAAAVGLALDIPFATIAEGLHAFQGTGRRFERLGETRNGVLVIDDYAHHPTEIRATLAAARAAYPGRRLVAVFQPHLPSRTRDFAPQFAEGFGDADLVVLTEIYSAREQPIEGVTGAALAALTADRRGAECVTYVADKADLPGRLAEMTRPGDVVLTLGAGDIRDAALALLARSGGTEGAS